MIDYLQFVVVTTVAGEEWATALLAASLAAAGGTPESAGAPAPLAASSRQGGCGELRLDERPGSLLLLLVAADVGGDAVAISTFVGARAGASSAADPPVVCTRVSVASFDLGGDPSHRVDHRPEALPIRSIHRVDRLFNPLDFAEQEVAEVVDGGLQGPPRLVREV